jgi:pSer/pThr/pTyr-binding forkhead associated (FHA) protein
MAPRDDKAADRAATTLVDMPVGSLTGGAGRPSEGGPPAIVAEFDAGDGPKRFSDTFVIGRETECALRVKADGVSRRHCEVSRDGDRWVLRDLSSTNGTWLDGLRVETAPLQNRNAVRLGRKGPVVWLTVEGPLEAPVSDVDLNPYLERYVEAEEIDGAGGHTLMVRKAIDVTRRRQHRRHLLGLVAVIVVAAVALTAVWRWRAAQVEAARSTASDIFYAMKDLELKLARLEQHLGEEATGSEQLESGRDRLGALETSYDRYLRELDLDGENTPERARLVLRIARVFGECEIGMPPTMVEEIDRYIGRWRRGTRLQKAIERAESNGFAARVAAAFDRVDLPPQYFYVALQESDFRPDVCGPETRYGIAKGAWQFIPATGRAYGLSIGPLYLERRFDPQDERHDFDLASDAAASYLRDIYLREAQGSGLLALAIYNYGGTNVRRLIRSLPESPRERNFWQVLIEHRDRFPQETYDYVLNVFSAAVIGENPTLFGFDFAPPLDNAINR